jgi:RNA polymerase sigma-70 factor, ECF subfamily
VMIQQMPIEEVARRLGSERNALYKLMHDARLRMKHRLAREGIAMEGIFAVFDVR